MDTLVYKSDNDIELIAPVLRSSSTVLTSGTCTARLFDVKREDFLTATNATNVLSVEGRCQFKVGESAYLELNDGTFHTSVITAVDPVAKTITLTGAPPSAAAAGRRVVRKIGADILMTAFNAAGAKATTEDWGWRGQMADDHAEVQLEMVVRVEITFDGGVAGRRLVRNKLFLIAEADQS